MINDKRKKKGKREDLFESLYNVPIIPLHGK